MNSNDKTKTIDAFTEVLEKLAFMFAEPVEPDESSDTPFVGITEPLLRGMPGEFFDSGFAFFFPTHDVFAKSRAHRRGICGR